MGAELIWSKMACVDLIDSPFYFSRPLLTMGRNQSAQSLASWRGDLYVLGDLVAVNYK